MKQLHKVVHRRKLNERKASITIFITQEERRKNKEKYCYRGDDNQWYDKQTHQKAFFMNGIQVHL